MPRFTLANGFDNTDRATIARLYWQAFSAKLGRVMGPDARALAFFKQIMDPDFAITARDAHGNVIGVAGFKTAKGALTGGGLRDLAWHYGWFGALWRGMCRRHTTKTWTTTPPVRIFQRDRDDLDRLT
jgi:hypothetical protein